MERELELLQVASDLMVEQDLRQTEYLKRDSDFSILETIESAGALSELRQRLPDSKLRRAQLALSPQRHWIAPKPGLSKILKPKDIDARIPEGLVIDISRIPLALAATLAGRKSIPKNDLNRIQLQTDALPVLQEMIAGSRALPLGPKHLPFYKILILEQPAGFEGKFLVFPRDPHNPSLYSVELVDDLHSLIRQYHHILQGYKVDPFSNAESLDTMTLREKELHLETQVTELHAHVLKNIESLRRNPKLLDEYRERAMALAGAYSKVKNTHKKKAVDRVSKAAIPQDSKGRLNLNAKLAQLIGSLNDLEKRTGETGKIDSTLSEQNKQVTELMWQCTGAFRRFNKLFRENPGLQKGFKADRNVYDFLDLLDRQGVDRKSLSRPDRFSFQPFRSYKDHLLPLVHVIEGHRNPAFLSDSNHALLGVYLLTKLWQYHNYLDNLLFDLNVRGESFDPQKAHQKITALLATFAEDHHKVMPGESYPEFDGIYSEVQALFSSLREKLQDCREFPEKKRLALSNEIKALGLSAKVQALPLPKDVVDFTIKTQKKRIKKVLNPSGGTESSS